jgi:hypothetical protein
MTNAFRASGDGYPGNPRGTIAERRSPFLANEGQREVIRVGIRDYDICIFGHGCVESSTTKSYFVAIVEEVISAGHANHLSIRIHL